MIYFIHNPELRAVKIGYSADPEARLKQLRTASPVGLELLAAIPGDQDRERELHQRFACRRLAGEWFRFDSLDVLFSHAADYLDGAARAVEASRATGRCYPELCAVVSLAVGFPCSIYWFGPAGPGGEGTAYQVMRQHDGPGEGRAFWMWYLFVRPQFYPSPELAVAHFIAGYREWCPERRSCAHCEGPLS